MITDPAAGMPRSLLNQMPRLSTQFVLAVMPAGVQFTPPSTEVKTVTAACVSFVAEVTNVLTYRFSEALATVG